MNKEEFEMSVAIDDEVKVKGLEEIRDIMPESLRKYCGKILYISAISRKNGNILLKNKKGEPILDGIFTYEMLELNKKGYLTYNAGNGNDRCGVLGEKTEMYDYDGSSLFVGDVVTVRSTRNKNDDKNKNKGIFEILDMIGITPYETIVTTVIENDGLNFVCGIKDEYNDKNMDTKKWIVKKIVDYSAVKDFAVINRIRYNLPIPSIKKEETEDEKQRTE